MFYINPINKGSIFSRNEIKDYLQKMDIKQDQEYFLPCNNQSIIKELLKNIIEVCEQKNQPTKIDELTYLSKLFKK